MFFLLNIVPDGEICDAVAVPVSNLLRLHPTAADELFIDGLDLLLNEFLQESSRSSFDAPHTTLLMVEVFAEIPGQVVDFLPCQLYIFRFQ